MHSKNFQLLSLRCARLHGNPVVALDSAKLCSSTPGTTNVKQKETTSINKSVKSIFL